MNLGVLRPKLSEEEYWKLKLLIHTRDTFKGESQPGVSITDPRSHASLARAFLTTHCDDADLLAMVLVAILLLAAIAIVASFLPARGAARLDPLTALRHE